MDPCSSLRNMGTHPGVFILHGQTSGAKNEMEIAHHLRERRGFRILDVTQADVPTIVSICAGARVVIGVEGSQQIHGILLLQAWASVLVLQPPNRFCSIYKDLTDRDHQHFGFVVGLPDGEDFYIDPYEVECTLDLMPA